MTTHRSPAPIEHMRKCVAHKRKTGEPCGKPAMRGQQVCTHHGGRAPQAQHAALERLKALQPQAVDVVAELMGDDASPMIRLAAAREVFDRTGVGKDKQIAANIVSFTLRIDRGGSDPDA